MTRSCPSEPESVHALQAHAMLQLAGCGVELAGSNFPAFAVYVGSCTLQCMQDSHFESGLLHRCTCMCGWAGLLHLILWAFALHLCMCGLNCATLHAMRCGLLHLHECGLVHLRSGLLRLLWALAPATQIQACLHAATCIHSFIIFAAIALARSMHACTCKNAWAAACIFLWAL